MTSIDIVPHHQHPTAKGGHHTQSHAVVDRSTLEDQATPNPDYTAHRNSSSSANYYPGNDASYALHHPEYSKQAKVQPFLQMLKSKFFISCLILAAVFVSLLCIGLVISYEKDNDVTHSIDAWKDQLSVEQSEWFDDGLDELKEALQAKVNTRRAKNVVLFVGDGMGPNTVTATRVHRYGEEGLLAWERFPHMGMLKVSGNFGTVRIEIVHKQNCIFL